MDISNENIRTHLLGSLILCGLVYLYWLAKELDHMDDLDRIVCVFLGFELNETIPLVLVCHLISWYVDINDGSALQK